MRVSYFELGVAESIELGSRKVSCDNTFWYFFYLCFVFTLGGNRCSVLGG